jgi:hypothetical protein
VIRVADRVWKEWRDVHEWGSIELLFSSALSEGDALAALEGAIHRTFRARIRDPEPGEDISPGAAFVVPVPGGIALRIDEHPDDFEGLVRAIVSELEADSVDGAFDVHEPPAVVEVSERVDLLECRLRLRGERYRLRNGRARWRPEPEALAAAAHLGIRWCVENDARLPLALKVQLMKPVVLRAADDLKRYVEHGLHQSADLGVVTLISAAPDRFRLMAIEPLAGRLTLSEGGAIVEMGWQDSLQALRAAMQAAAPWAVYGFVKRGSNRVAAELGNSLYQHWVTVLHLNPLTQLADPFEDEFAPDAFGLQLLGPGYDGRIPKGHDWRQDPVGDHAIILEHSEPHAWFSHLFGTFGGHPMPPTDPAEIPEVVSRARHDFTDILFADHMAGFPRTA